MTSRWYDMDGNELHDMRIIEALLRDIDARRVMLTEFGERARVSTVLLVLDHIGLEPKMAAGFIYALRERRTPPEEAKS